MRKNAKVDRLAEDIGAVLDRHIPLRDDGNASPEDTAVAVEALVDMLRTVTGSSHVDLICHLD